jgi:hypothetical protein
LTKLAVAGLLVAVGLGVGLWLGFDPQGRAVAQENMQRADQFFAEAGADLGLWLNGLTTNDPAEPNGAQSQGSEAQDNSTQEVAFVNFWDATRQVWFSLLSRLGLAS